MAAFRRQPLPAIFLTVFIDLLGFGLLLPSLAYMGGRFGATNAQIGLLQTSYSLTQFIFAPFWGWLSDRVGRRPVMLASITGVGLSYLVFGFSGSLAMLFVARAAAGAFAANISTAQAFVADVTTPENRAKGMGVVGAALGLGFTLGPPIGGFLAGDTHFERPAFFAAGLCALNLVMAALSLPDSPRTSSQRRPGRFKALLTGLAQPQLAVLIVLFFLVVFAFANMEQALVLATWKEFSWGPRKNGELMGIAGILIVVMQGGLIGRLTKRFGERRLLISGTIAMSVGLLLLAISHAPWEYFIALMPLAIGQGLAHPSLASLVSRVAPVTNRGSTLGVSQSAASLARILAPMWAGWSFDHISYGAPFGSGAIIMALGILLAVTIPAATEVAAAA